MSTHATRLNLRIERILEETGERREGRFGVIVQMRPSPQAQAELCSIVNTATAVVRQRRMAMSARELMPAPRSALRGDHAGLTKTQKRDLSEARLSMASQIALTAVAMGASLGGSLGSTADPFAGRAIQALLDSGELASAAAAGIKASKGKPAARAQALAAAPGLPAASGLTVLDSSGSIALAATQDELRRLAQRDDVADILPNRTLRSAPVAIAREWPAEQRDNLISTWGLRAIGALDAWGAFDARGQGVKVAVLDTGVDPSHPDLAGKIAGFAEFDAQGRVLVDDPAKAYDSGQHGTHCAATIVGGNSGGKDDDRRHIGVAPKARILAGLVLKNGEGTDAQILAGIDWALRHGADVISMSLGGLRMGPDVMDTYTRAIIAANAKGVPVVVAIGNDGHQTTGMPGSDYFAFAVGATAPGNRAAGFSGGRTQIIESSEFIQEEFLPLVYSKPEVSAPGVAVLSAVPGGGREAWNGTSMATPHVAGALAQVLSGTNIKAAVPAHQRAFMLQDILTASVEELGEAGQNHRFGYGLIDVLRAIGMAKQRGY